MIAGRPAPPRARSAVAVALAIVLLAALGLRFYGLNWDEGQDLHPDELFIAKIVLIDRIRLDWPPDLSRLLDPAVSGLNPRSVDPVTGEYREFAYGALPLLVTDAVAGALSLLTGADWNAADRAYLVGRTLSALLDVGTAEVVFLLARRLAGARAGLLAAAVAALAPMSIQLAHFFTTDAWLTFFVALTLWLLARAVDGGHGRSLALAGATTGLALATKGSAFPLAALLGLAWLLQAVRRDAEAGWRLAASPLRLGSRLAGAAAAVLVAFALFEPFALLRPDVYLESLRTQADIVRGTFDVPFTRVFVGASPFHAFEQWFRWGYGPVAGVLALAGLAIITALARRGSPAAALLLAWAVVYAGVVVSAEVQFLRYLAPLTPVLAVAAGLALDCLSRVGGMRLPRRIGVGVAAVAVVGVAAWTAAFASVYAGEHPRLAASRWMYAALPGGATLTAEYWDDALPRDFGIALGGDAFGFATLTADLYADRPPAQVADDLWRLLRRADAIVLSSNRVETAIRAAPWRYPVQARFYDLLDAGALGFRLAGDWERRPRLGPIAFDDRNADESFINYDHPRVRVYLREATLGRAAYDDLMAWAVARPWQPTRHPLASTLLLDRPVGELPVVADARWSAAVSGSTVGAMAAWLLLLVVLQAAGLPLARVLLPRFADAGWGFSRLLAVVVAGYLVWLGASLQVIAFRAVWCALALALVAVVGWLSLRKQGMGRKALFRRDRYWLTAEAVFVATFLLFGLFRLLNPDGWHPIWGGEKPMEFAHLNAILRSAHFPPYDPWFSDGYLNYYYYGIYLVAFLLKLTGIPSEIGFNLAQPTVMALLASGVFSLAATLGRALNRKLGIPAGLAGCFFAVVAGNLTSAVALLTPERPPLSSFLDWTWAGSRAIEDAITEFPFFTGLYADLHAHVVALPLTVLAAALAFALASTGRASGPPPTLRRVAPVGLALALVLGSLWATNPWDVPTYAALGVAAVWMTTAAVAPWPARLVAFALGSGGLLAVAYVLFLPFHRSFVALFGSLAPVRAPTPVVQWTLHVGGLAAIAAVVVTVLLLPRHAQGRLRWYRPATLMAAALAVVAAARAAELLTGRSLPLVGAALVALVAAMLFVPAVRVPAAHWVERLPVVAGAVAAVVALALGREVLALAVAALAATGTGWLRLRRTAARFWCLLFATAAGVVAGVELVVVVDDLIETPAYRMNTVFKFYNQVWLLLAIAAGAGVAVLLAAARLGAIARAPQPVTVALVAAAAPARTGPARAAGQALRAAWARFGLALGAVVAVASLAYPLLAIGPRLGQRFPDPPPLGTLNALDWMETASLPSLGGESAEIRFAGDRAAIDWFNRTVAGSPVVAEASIGPYRCNGSRISIGTGLPTIIGWERHEMQQRFPGDLPGRVDDVRRLYRSANPGEKEAILRRYNVAYVVVGDLERVYPRADNDCTATGSAAGIVAFDAMVGESLEVAFQSGGTTIYRVLPPRSGRSSG